MLFVRGSDVRTYSGMTSIHAKVYTSVRLSQNINTYTQCIPTNVHNMYVHTLGLRTVQCIMACMYVHTHHTYAHTYIRIYVRTVEPHS